MTLVLVRHAAPQIERGRPSATWELSASGRREAAAIAEPLRSIGVVNIVSSVEPKAAQTAQSIATELQLQTRTYPGLEEHHRPDPGWLPTDEWQALLKRFFAHHDELVFGSETASQALERFSGAVDLALSHHDRRDGALVIVSHGTVMALYLANARSIDPYPIWRNLSMPDYVVLE